MPSRWSRDQRWGGAGRIVPDPPPAADPVAADAATNDEPGAPEVVELAGVGDVRLLRTFRVGDDGGLYPVNSADAWAAGRNTATCLRNPNHHAPEAQCRCGFYAYSDAAYVREQPPARQVLAVVATHGTMEAGTRGARVERARIEALWLGERVSEAAAAAVQRRYPSVAIYRDRAKMQAACPLTQLAYFRPPRVGVAARERLRVAMWTFLGAVTAIGCVPATAVVSTLLGAIVWLTLVLTGLGIVFTGIAQRSSVLAVQGVGAVGWLLTANPTSASGWAGRLVLVLMMGWVMFIWRRAATPGRPVRATRMERFFGRTRGRMPGSPRGRWPGAR